MLPCQVLMSQSTRQQKSTKEHERAPPQLCRLLLRIPKAGSQPRAASAPHISAFPTVFNVQLHPLLNPTTSSLPL